MDQGINIPKLYEQYLNEAHILHEDMRKETADRINALIKSDIDATEITAVIFALIAYHYNGNTNPIATYPGKCTRMMVGKLYYNVSDLDDDLIRVLSRVV